MKPLNNCIDSNYTPSIQSSTSQNITNTENPNQTTPTLEEDKNCMEEEDKFDASEEEAFSSSSNRNYRSSPHCSRLEDPSVEDSPLGSFHSKKAREDEHLLHLLVSLIEIAPNPEWILKFTSEDVIYKIAEYLNDLESLYQLISIDFHSNWAQNKLSGYYKELHDNNEKVYSSLVLLAAYTSYILYPPHNKYYRLSSDIVQHASLLCKCFEITNQDFVNSSKLLIDNTMSLLEITNNLKSSLKELSAYWIIFENVLFF